MPEGLTLSELAAALGVSRAELAEAINAGRITAGDGGRFDLDQARAVWGKIRGKEKPQQPVGDDPLGYASARARRELAAARIMELREARLRGEYLRADDVTETISDIVTTMRAGLESLPIRLASEIVGKDLDEIRSLLKREVHDALTDMANQFERQLAEIARPDESELTAARI